MGPPKCTDDGLYFYRLEIIPVKFHFYFCAIFINNGSAESAGGRWLHVRRAVFMRDVTRDELASRINLVLCLYFRTPPGNNFGFRPIGFQSLSTYKQIVH